MQLQRKLIEDPSIRQEGLKGQIATPEGNCYCTKEERWLSSKNFYTYKDSSKPLMCKSCMTMHIDNFDENTFIKLIEDMDIPYIPSKWNSLRDKAFAKDPKKMNGMSVFGKYISSMKIKPWNAYGWADTQQLQKQMNQKDAAAREEQRKADIEYAKQLQLKLESHEINESQFRTLVPVSALNELAIPTSTDEVYGKTAIGNTFAEQNYISEDKMPDPAKDLTEDDKLYLAMKWGRLYKPNEWVILQQDYNNMLDSFDVQDADTKNSLIVICKLNLKTNQALDCGDYDSFTKLSRELGNQRKLANFAASSRKTTDDNGNAVDSIGQLVAYCQKHGGYIPQKEIEAPRDVIDTIIRDQKEYLKTLIYEDISLAREIEDYLKKLKNQEELKRNREQAESAGLEDWELTDEEISDYQEFLRQQREIDFDMANNSEGADYQG